MNIYETVVSSSGTFAEICSEVWKLWCQPKMCSSRSDHKPEYDRLLKLDPKVLINDIIDYMTMTEQEE